MIQARRFATWTIFFIAGLIFISRSGAQPSTGAARPAIGIALEGGGALGLAHIGVLKWMEENRIPVYFVGGTSMGGLVGGMYSLGMTPAEIEKLTSAIDWDAALGQQISYQDLAYRRKLDRRTFQNSLEFGLRKGFSIPGGLNSGQEITFLFDRNVLPYSDLKTFDELPIPFRCVAVDLTSGKAHVFDQGPLGEALRATMSLPAIFTPVQQAKGVYADGGLLDNLPVDVVRGMGAGIVIGVHLDAHAEVPDQQSIFSVMGRSIDIVIAANELRSMEKADILLSVNLKGFTGTEYKRGVEIAAQGYAAAKQKAALLSAFALSEEEWRRHIDRRQSRKKKSVAAPTSVEIAGVADPLKSDLEAALSQHAGKPLDIEKLESDIHRIAGVGRYSRFSYRMRGDAQSSLVVNAEERGYAPPFFNLGLIVDGNDYNNVRFTTTGRITALDVGGYRSEWRTDFSLGSTWGLATEFYKPLSATSRWFVAPRLSAVNNPFDLYDRSDRIASYRLTQYGGGLDLGYEFNRFSELRMGYEIGYFDSKLNIGDPVLPTPSGRTGTTTVRYDLDKYDDPIVPRTGQALRWRVQWLDALPGASDAFPLSEVNFTVVRPVTKPGSAYIQAFGGSTFGENDTGLPQFYLGGAGRLGAYGINELRGNQYFLGRVGYLHEIGALPPLVGRKIYLTTAYELGKMYGARLGGSSRLPMDGAIGIIAETFLGPISVGGSVGDRGHKRWYFQVGRLF